MITATRVSITVPKDLRERMHMWAGWINWSAVASEAFENAIAAEQRRAEEEENERFEELAREIGPVLRL